MDESHGRLVVVCDVILRKLHLKNSPHLGWLIVRTRYPHVCYVTITWYLAVSLYPLQLTEACP